jgi:hypothetical protein
LTGEEGQLVTRVTVAQLVFKFKKGKITKKTKHFKAVKGLLVFVLSNFR